jgi:hypothetical protein
MTSLLGELMLHGDSMRAALHEVPRLSGLPADFASTDLYPYLEYQTPKGNTLSETTISANLNFMLALRPANPLPPQIKLLNVPSEDEKNLLRGYALTQRGELARAVEYLKRVDGRFRARAEEEAALIESGARRPKRLGL